MSASWFLSADQTIIGVGDFITSTIPDYRSACAAEMYGCLETLQTIDKLFADNEDATQINLHIVSDCLGVVRELEKDSKVANMSTKLHRIIREILALKLKRLRSLMFTKVDAHQGHIKSLDQLSFLEQLNVECDIRTKTTNY